MQRLILFRHARAEAGSGGRLDFDRTLTPEGRADAELMGRVLAGMGLAPDRAVVSSAARTTQTWEAVSTAFPGAQAEFDRTLYEASSRVLAAAAERWAPSSDILMLVGHNPGLQLCAMELAQGQAQGRQVEAGFPTSTAAIFTYDDGKPALERVLRVQDFRDEA